MKCISEKEGHLTEIHPEQSSLPSLFDAQDTLPMIPLSTDPSLCVSLS